MVRISSALAGSLKLGCCGRAVRWEVYILDYGRLDGVEIPLWNAREPNLLQLVGVLRRCLP